MLRFGASYIRDLTVDVLRVAFQSASLERVAGWLQNSKEDLFAQAKYCHRWLTHCPLGVVAVIVKIWFSDMLHRTAICVIAVELHSDECHNTPLLLASNITWTRDILQWDAKAVFVTTVIADGTKSKSEFKYAMHSGRHIMRRGCQCTNIYIWALLWHHTFVCKQWNQNLPTHKFFSALLCSYFLLYLRHDLNGNTNFKIYLSLASAIHAIWQLGPQLNCLPFLFEIGHIFCY